MNSHKVREIVSNVGLVPSLGYSANSTYEFESILVQAELNKLLAFHGEKFIDDIGALQAIREFLANRWQRICDTQLGYFNEKTNRTNILCTKLAEQVVKTEAGMRDEKADSAPRAPSPESVSISINSLLMPKDVQPLDVRDKFGKGKLNANLFTEDSYARIAQELSNPLELSKVLFCMKQVFDLPYHACGKHFLEHLEMAKLKAFFNNEDEFTSLLSSIWLFLSRHAQHALIEELKEERLLAILSEGYPALPKQEQYNIKSRDFHSAMEFLDKAIKKNGGEAANKLACELYAELAVAKRSASREELPVLTELAYRSGLFIDKPGHEGNLKRYPIIANKVKERSWGRIAGGIALLLFATVCLAAAVMCAMATAGAALPLSGLIAWGALQAASASYLSIMGFTLAGVGAGTVAACKLYKGEYYKVGQAGLTLFNTKKPVQKDEKPEEPKPADPLNNQRLE